MNNDLYLIEDCSGGMTDAIATAQGVIDFARQSVDIWKDGDNHEDEDITRIINDCYKGLKGELDYSAHKQAETILDTDNYDLKKIPDNTNVIFNHKTEKFSFVNKDYTCNENELLIEPETFITEGTYKGIF